MIRNTVFAAVLLAPLAATAQELPTAPYLPVALATKAADAALQACLAEGHNVSVAIVARDGSTKVLLKGDNSGPHTGSSAQGKAFTSAALGRDTAGLAEFIASKPANDGLRDMDDRMVIQTPCRSSSARQRSAASVSAVHRRAISTLPARLPA